MYEYKAVITNVVDGDTFDMDIDLGFHIHIHERVRLLDVDTPEKFGEEKLVDAYDWDFCQIQYNYMDEHSQAGRRGLYHAHAKGLPVIIMEPLRGGKLVNKLPENAKKLFEEHKNTKITNV